MSKLSIADKENLRERNEVRKNGAGEASFKGMTNVYRKDNITSQDKSSRLSNKKECIKGLTHVYTQYTSSNVQNNSKKIYNTMGRNEDSHKESSQPAKKSGNQGLTHPSIVSHYLSRDREARLMSKGKQKGDVESEKKVQKDVLQPSKSIMQIQTLKPKIQAILNSSKRGVKLQKENMDASSISNASEISEVSRNQVKLKTTKEKEISVSLKSREPNQALNFSKGNYKNNFLAKKLDNVSKPTVKRNVTSMNRSKLIGSASSIEHTPDRVDKDTIEIKKQVTSKLLINQLSLQVKETALKHGGVSKNLKKLKKEKLVCLENLIVKDTESSSSPKMGTSEMISIKKQEKKYELTMEEEIDNFVQDYNDEVYTPETLSYLIQSEAEYMPDPYYLDKNQMELKWKMRAMLLDWMVMGCSDFTLKISTFTTQSTI